MTGTVVNNGGLSDGKRPPATTAARKTAGTPAGQTMDGKNYRQHQDQAITAILTIKESQRTREKPMMATQKENKEEEA